MKTFNTHRLLISKGLTKHIDLYYAGLFDFKTLFSIFTKSKENSNRGFLYHKEREIEKTLKAKIIKPNSWNNRFSTCPVI